jgi:hypothetical protein
MVAAAQRKSSQPVNQISLTSICGKGVLPTTI